MDKEIQSFQFIFIGQQYLSFLLCYSVFHTLLPCLPYPVFLKHWAIFSIFCQFIYLADNV